MARLRKDQIISTVDGKTIKVLGRIGEGGQGIVYKIKCENKNYALKWYKKPCDDSFYKNLCDRSLTNEANEIKNDLNEIAKNTNYEEEFNDLAYELITNKYKHIFEREF